MMKAKKTPGAIYDEMLANPRRLALAHLCLGLIAASAYWILDSSGNGYIADTVVSSTLCRCYAHCRHRHGVVAVSNFNDCLSITFIEP